MATSGTTAFSLTVRDVIDRALIDELGVYGDGETVDADALSVALGKLASMLKSWQLKGVLWKQETVSDTGTADTATIALDSFVRGVNGCRYVESATNERQMTRWGRDEYMSIPNKAASGTPTIYYVQRAEDGLVLSVWPVPTANFTLKLDIDRAMDTVTDAGETLDVPEELHETVIANLAVRLMGKYRISPGELPELVSRAQMLERQMLDNYRPASYMLGAC
tara:strand:- start:6320 stop:6985 length:666 start_codon:yes stop_codon:yes gene_type:complete